LPAPHSCTVIMFAANRSLSRDYGRTHAAILFHASCRSPEFTALQSCPSTPKQSYCSGSPALRWRRCTVIPYQRIQRRVLAAASRLAFKPVICWPCSGQRRVRLSSVPWPLLRPCCLLTQPAVEFPRRTGRLIPALRRQPHSCGHLAPSQHQHTLPPLTWQQPRTHSKQPPRSFRLICIARETTRGSNRWRACISQVHSSCHPSARSELTTSELTISQRSPVPSRSTQRAGRLARRRCSRQSRHCSRQRLRRL
jgi:hypothetical protein